MKPIGGERKVAGDVDDGLTFVIEQNCFRYVCMHIHVYTLGRQTHYVAM